MLDWIGLLIVGAILLPWIAIAIGSILVGIIAISRGERALIVCFPAGLALFVLPTLLIYLDRRWYPRISQFILEDNRLTFMRTHDPVATSRQISDVRWVERRRRRGRTHGYLVKFIDGSGIFLCWSLSNADELAIALKKGSETSVNDAC
jgi:hypothetical protein